MPDATSREPLKNSLEMRRRNRERLFRRLNAVEENATSASEPFLDPPLPRPLTLPRSGPRPYAIFVLGCGTGQVVNLVRDRMATEKTETVVVVVEPDLARLRRSFQIHDWSNSMADPRIRFAAGEDLDLAIRDALPDALDPIRTIALGVAILPGEQDLLGLLGLGSSLLALALLDGSRALVLVVRGVKSSEKVRLMLWRGK